MSETEQEKDLDTESTFFKKIETNSSVCTNCYRRVKSYSKPHHRAPDALSDDVEYEEHVKWSWVDDRSNTGRPCVKRSYCKCGNIDDAKLRPIEPREVMTVAQRVARHLDEQDIEIDEDVFFSYIRDHRHDSDMHFNAEKYFETAIEKSLITNE